MKKGWKQLRAEYQAYIDSDAWKAVRERYRQQRPWACGVCGAKRKLHLHHLTYERFGSEALDDLVPLCEKHHKEAHRLAKSGVPLWEAHSQINHPERLVVLPPGRPRRKKKEKKTWKYRPRTKFFIVSPDRVQCPQCHAVYSPGYPKLRCDCGGILRFVKPYEPGRKRKAS